jgi:hypothetical protein
LDAADELADELEELTPEDRERLKTSIADLSRDTPRTEVASTRVKKILKKLGSASATALKSILVDVATEAAKKSLGL